MVECPFTIISCSWPRPIKQVDGYWASDPEWDAPLMPTLPQPKWEIIRDELCWVLNWSELFRSELKPWDPLASGEMRGFHIIFDLQINSSGELVFWDDGCIIRCNGKIIHSNRSTHALTQSTIKVSHGDYLEIAQPHMSGEWLWGTPLNTTNQTTFTIVETILTPYLEIICEHLRHPNGPALKMYTSGHAPIRTIVAIYSMVLNGYVPRAVYLFGEHQWHRRTWDLFSAMLPFVQLISTDKVITQLQSLGAAKLVEIAQGHWFVMKMCASLLYPPEECCMMDDDVLILDHLHDALKAFEKNNLVYEPDIDQGEGYVATWDGVHTPLQPLRTARFNAGLYWLRNTKDLRWLASQALHGYPNSKEAPFWEQGFIATIYAQEDVVELPSQRYFYPVLDGLPGGMLGYDYKHNPCGFASIHFGGLVKKPSEGTILHLVPQLLNRS